MKFKRHPIKSLSKYPINGYIGVYYPEHPSATSNGTVYLHRLVMENHLGRFLSSNELVHHRNEDRSDYSISNLKLTTRSKHAKHHQQFGKVRKKKRCPECQRKFLPARKKQLYCSSFCFRKSIIPPIPAPRLKKLVWKYPLTHLSRKFGISDTCLANWCDRLGIKRPKAGYWSKPRI